ncbi:hypothetical protein LS70_009815 [Helicobacter sp. MIT 11-5569]|nr:hypothetical protein LS70_009815 [Helicobacter sp. MIT 11-5569]
MKNSDNVYWARDNKQIKEIWDDITEGAEIIDRDKPDKLGGKLTIAKLRDGTIVRLRQKSKTGGSTIEIGNKKPNVTIHNKAKEDGDW